MKGSKEGREGNGEFRKKFQVGVVFNGGFQTLDDGASADSSEGMHWESRALA